MIDTAAIIAGTDLVALVREHIKLIKRGKDWYGSCPFHSGDRTPSFAVVPAKRFYHCHSCEAHGDAISFVMRIEQLSFQDACTRLGGAAASPETDRRLAADRRAREQAEIERQRRIDAQIALDWEATSWMEGWGQWLRNMNIQPQVFQ